MPTVIYAVLIFAVLGFAISYVLVNGAKKDVLSENEKLENDAEFKEHKKAVFALLKSNLIYGIFIFLFARARYLNGELDMSVMGSSLIIFIVLNFISGVASGFIFSDSIKNYATMDSKEQTKEVFKFALADLIALAGIAYFLLKVAGVI